jgi:hypothetical protein
VGKKPWQILSDREYAPARLTASGKNAYSYSGIAQCPVFKKGNFPPERANPGGWAIDR